MEFKIDENLPIEAAQLLRLAGHSADTVHDEQLTGHPDPDIAAVCRRESRILVTLDLDFADIRVYPPEQYAGVIVLRPRLQAKPDVLSLLKRLVGLLGQQPLEKMLWIVDESRLRVRGNGQND